MAVWTERVLAALVCLTRMPLSRYVLGHYTSLLSSFPVLLCLLFVLSFSLLFGLLLTISYPVLLTSVYSRSPYFSDLYLLSVTVFLTFYSRLPYVSVIHNFVSLYILPLLKLCLSLVVTYLSAVSLLSLVYPVSRHLRHIVVLLLFVCFATQTAS